MTAPRLTPAADWPESWRLSWRYDRMEVWGEPDDLGYLYAYERRRDVTLQLVADAVPRAAHVLDIAAAQGNFSLALARSGYEVTWNDLRAELADYVRMKLAGEAIRFAPGNAFELRFDALFDAVLVTEVIEHVAHPDQFLAKAASLVRPGGCLILTTPNGAYFRNRLPRFSDCPDPSRWEAEQFRPDADGHLFLLHADEIHTLAAQAGLTVERVVLFTTPLTHGFLGTGSLLRMLPRAAVQAVEAASGRLPNTWRERLCLQLGACLRRPAEAAPAARL